MLWGDEERWEEVRQRLAEHLREEWENSAIWTRDEHYARLQRIDDEGRLMQLGECSPGEYAAEMLDEHHAGSSAEWHIGARTFGINLVAAHRVEVEGRAELQLERYP